MKTNLRAPSARAKLAFTLLAAVSLSLHTGAADFSKALVPFTANQGRVRDSSVKFIARPMGGAVYVRNDGSMLYAMPQAADSADRPGAAGLAVMEERFIGAEKLEPNGLMPSAARISRFIGSDSKAWETDVPAWDRVSVGEPYPGIGLTLTARGSNVEKLFTVAPGSDPAVIRLAVAGAESLAVTDSGELAVQTALGEIRFTKPVAYQENPDGSRELVQAAYEVAGLTYGFALGQYDRERPLLIDPLLASTYLGGKRGDTINAMALDAHGNVYVAGSTDSENFPTTPGTYQPSMDESAPSGEGFITCLNPSLTEVIASTFIGGEHADGINAIALSSDGYVYVAGDTLSTNFPTTDGAYCRTLSGSDQEDIQKDIFVARLSRDLSRLDASTYLGGSAMEMDPCMAQDVSSAVIVGGRTWSTNFPTTSGVIQPNKASPDERDGEGFVSVFSRNLGALVASTYIGGSNFDEVTSLALGSDGALYAAGTTGGDGFPVKANAYQRELGGGIDGFVALFSSTALNELVAATYLGGASNEIIAAMAVDWGSSVYVAGITHSANFPTTPTSFQPDRPGNGEGDGFIAQLSADLTGLKAGAFLGGSDTDYATCLARTREGALVVGGYTFSADFRTTQHAFRRTLNGSTNVADVFLARVSPGLGELLASTYFGGTMDDFVNAIALNDKGDVLFAGKTESEFKFNVTPAAFSTRYNDAQHMFLLYGDGYVSRLDANLSRQGTPNNDYDGDGISEMAVFDQTDGYWYADSYFGDFSLWGVQWGWPGAWPVPGDYDGDRVSDLAVFDSNSGNWFILSATNSIIAWAEAWGWPGARPLPGDYDGDGISDLAVFDNATGHWYAYSLANTNPVLLWAQPWGWPGARPLPGDYDGDGASELTVFDAATGIWYIRAAADPSVAWIQPWGWPGAWPVPGNYDRYKGDDLAVFDTNTGLWYILSSHTGVPAWALPWGWPGAMPVPGDYDGDGVNDLALFDTNTGDWYVWSLADDPGHVIIWGRKFGWPGAFPVGCW